MRAGDPWNMNIHYDAVLAARVPAGARSVLDVGCGDGFLAARLAAREPGPVVVGLDADGPVLERAQARFPDANVHWRQGDALTIALPEAPFDAVLSNSVLHHFPDSGAALARLGSLVRPGGMLALVTFARVTPRDLPWAAFGSVARGAAIRMHRRRFWEHTAPMCWPPQNSVHELREIAGQALPGARVRRLPMGRVLLEWHCPQLKTPV